MCSFFKDNIGFATNVRDGMQEAITSDCFINVALQVISKHSSVFVPLSCLQSVTQHLCQLSRFHRSYILQILRCSMCNATQVL